MQVIFYPEKETPSRQGSLYLDNVLFNPGVNEVDDSVTSHRSWQRLVDSGVLKVVKNPKPVVTPTKISGLTIDEATPIIEEETDVKVLNDWLESDGRTGIKALINRQLKFLETI